MPIEQVAVTPKHVYILDPAKSNWTDHAAWDNELTRNSSRSARIQSSELAEPRWSDAGLKREIGARELIFSLKKKIGRRGVIRRTFPPNPRMRGKSHHHHHCQHM